MPSLSASRVAANGSSNVFPNESGSGVPRPPERLQERGRVQVEEAEPVVGRALERVLVGLVVRERLTALARVDDALHARLARRAPRSRRTRRRPVIFVDHVLDVLVGLARDLALGGLLERVLGLSRRPRRHEHDRVLPAGGRSQPVHEEGHLVAEPGLDVLLEAQLGSPTRAAPSRPPRAASRAPGRRRGTWRGSRRSPPSGPPRARARPRRTSERRRAPAPTRPRPPPPPRCRSPRRRGSVIDRAVRRAAVCASVLLSGSREQA